MTDTAIETRRFAVMNILISHCGQKLTPELIEAIVEEMQKEMNDSPCAWAFQGGKP